MPVYGFIINVQDDNSRDFIIDLLEKNKIKYGYVAGIKIDEPVTTEMLDLITGVKTKVKYFAGFRKKENGIVY